MNVLPAIHEILTYTGVRNPFAVRVVRTDGDEEDFPVLVERLSDGMRTWVHPRNLKRNQL
jgi:hypothetical protein